MQSEMGWEAIGTAHLLADYLASLLTNELGNSWKHHGQRMRGGLGTKGLWREREGEGEPGSLGLCPWENTELLLSIMLKTRIGRDEIGGQGLQLDYGHASGA